MEPPALTPGLIRFMTAACGLAVANLYYNQPLLPAMGHDLAVGSREMGVVAMLTQVGYALAMLFVVPLGDMHERRGLVVAAFVAASAALVAAALAPGYPALAAASLAVGAATVAPQLLIPFAAQLAAPGSRGRVVGTLMGGLLAGILLARTVAGFVGAHLGWRWMFGLAAALMLGLAAAARLALPAYRVAEPPTYGALMGSLAALPRAHPVLVEAAATGALMFGAFSVFWTTLAFWLASPAFGLGSQAAGLFGLVGLVGVVAAPVAGRLADRRGPRLAIGGAIALVLAAYATFAAAGATLAGLVAGVVLVDLGVQAAQVSNQARIYALPKAIHSRANTIYMTAYFVGGATGSAAGAWAWTAAGWPGVCALGAALAGAAGGVFLAAGGRHEAVKGEPPPAHPG
jgi:predicted MFS family arabinose efflux permease